jgi:hypothetical protein
MAGQSKRTGLSFYICRKCNNPQPSEQFRLTPAGYARAWCRECERKYNRDRARANPSPRQSPHYEIPDKETCERTLRTCCRCKQLQPLVAFRRSRSHPQGHQYECKACFNTRRSAKRRDWTKAHPRAHSGGRPRLPQGEAKRRRNARKREWIKKLPIEQRRKYRAKYKDGLGWSRRLMRAVRFG